MQTTAARLGIEESQIELTKYLMAELAMVIRGHLHIEDALIDFIKATGYPTNAIPWKYAHRVQLAMKQGLPAEFTKQLIFLGKLRNRFGHNKKAAIHKSDAEAFDATHEPGDTVIEYAYNTTLAKMEDQNRKRSVYDLEPKERVIMHIIALWAGVAVATARLPGRARITDQHAGLHPLRSTRAA
jgi:hypothetical protein